MSISAPVVVPAQLSYLAIYNPSLGQRDENLHDQIVFYTSRAAIEARISKREGKKTAKEDAAAERNNQLRQVGLAQGLVSFAR
jgi:hypothetical protein